MAAVDPTASADGKRDSSADSEDAKWNDDGAGTDDIDEFEPSFWRNETVLIAMTGVVFLFDLGAAISIYVAVSNNDRPSGT